MNKSTLAAILVCLSQTLLADQLTLKNGDRLTGKIVTSDDKAVLLKTDYAGEIKIDRTVVTGIQTDEAINVTLKDAGKVQGKVQATTETAKVEKLDGSVVNVEPGAVIALRNYTAQRDWEREQERLQHPKLRDFWAGFVGLALTNSNGNSKTTSVGTTGSATRIAGKNKMALYFAQLYASQSTTAPFGTTANRVTGSFRIDRDLSPKLFVYGVNAYDYDQFLDLDLRVVLGGGFGYHVWKSQKGYFDVAAGANWNREKFSTVTGNLVRNSAELQVSEEFGYQVFEKLKLFERLTVFPNMTDLGQYRVNFDLTASVPVAKWLELTLGFNDRYLSNPLPGKVKNDTILTMGVRATFDQTKR